MDPIFIESRLVAATVYGDRARVSRQGHAELAAGTSQIAWLGLPADIAPAEVRVLTDRGQVRVVETAPVPLAPSQLPERPAETLRSEVHRLVAAQEALRTELELLDGVMPSRDSFSAALRPDLFVKGLDAITARRRAALAELRKAATAHAEAQRALERAEAEARDRAPTHRQTLIATIDVTDPGPATLRVSYVSGWATWRPLYHLQLGPGADRVEIVRFGDVWQDTGEDWSQLRLLLSTAEPEVGLRLATVQPWVLQLSSALDDDLKSLYRRADRDRTVIQAAPAPDGAPPGAPVPAASDAESTGDITGEFEAPDVFDTYASQFEEQGIFADQTSPGLAAARALGGDGDSTLPPTGLPAPQSESLPPAPPPPAPDQHRGRWDRAPEPRDASGGIDMEIPVARPFTARSGPDRHRVQLGRRTYPLSLWYILRPGLRDHAFGRAEIVNEDPDPILAGPTSLFVDGAFHGHTRLATTPGRGKLILDLGAETSIKCVRRTDTQVRREGLIAKDEVQTVEVTLEIESFLTSIARVQVQDQVPVATDPQVRVSLLNTAPADAVLDDETGLVTFSTQIEPGAKTILTLSYEVSAPAGYRLTQGLGDEVTP